MAEEKGEGWGQNSIMWTMWIYHIAHKHLTLFTNAWFDDLKEQRLFICLPSYGNLSNCK